MKARRDGNKQEYDSPLRGFEGSESGSEERHSPLFSANPAIKVVCRKRPTTRRRETRPQSEFALASFQPQTAREVTVLRSLIQRTEHIPMLDESLDSSGSEAEARRVLETLHLRFSPEPRRCAPAPLPSAKATKRTSVARCRSRYQTLTQSSRSKSPLVPHEPPEPPPHKRKFPAFPCFRGKPLALTRKRTVDKSAFLLVANRQCSQRMGSYGGNSCETFDSLRPTSASALPGRVLRRPASVMRNSNR